MSAPGPSHAAESVLALSCRGQHVQKHSNQLQPEALVTEVAQVVSLLLREAVGGTTRQGCAKLVDSLAAH